MFMTEYLFLHRSEKNMYFSHNWKLYDSKLNDIVVIILLFHPSTNHG